MKQRVELAARRASSRPLSVETVGEEDVRVDLDRADLGKIAGRLARKTRPALIPLHASFIRSACSVPETRRRHLRAVETAVVLQRTESGIVVRSVVRARHAAEHHIAVAAIEA